MNSTAPIAANRALRGNACTTIDVHTLANANAAIVASTAT